MKDFLLDGYAVDQGGKPMLATPPYTQQDLRNIDASVSILEQRGAPR